MAPFFGNTTYYPLGLVFTLIELIFLLAMSVIVFGLIVFFNYEKDEKISNSFTFGTLYSQPLPILQ